MLFVKDVFRLWLWHVFSSYFGMNTDKMLSIFCMCVCRTSLYLGYVLVSRYVYTSLGTNQSVLLWGGCILSCEL